MKTNMNTRKFITRGLIILSLIAGVGLFLDPSRGHGENSANLALEKYLLAIEEKDITGIERLTHVQSQGQAWQSEQIAKQIDRLRGCKLVRDNSTKIKEGYKPGEATATVKGVCEDGTNRSSRVHFYYEGGSIVNMFGGKWYLDYITL
jgi:hypothetical protein